jgi:hypothetical protein
MPVARERFANNAVSTLALAIDGSTTALTLTGATGFPDPDFRIVVDTELMLCTVRAGTSLTVTRGAEGTAPVSHAAGAAVTVVLTAASMDALQPFTTRGDLLRGAPDGLPQRLALGTVGQVLTSDGTDALWRNVLTDLVFIIDGGGAVIPVGVRGDLSPNYSGVITGWRLLADQTGSIVVDIWASSYASYPPVVAGSVMGGEKVTLSGGIKAEDLTFGGGAGWAFNAGDVLRFNVDSVTSIRRASLILATRRTS